MRARGGLFIAMYNLMMMSPKVREMNETDDLCTDRVPPVREYRHAG